MTTPRNLATRLALVRLLRQMCWAAWAVIVVTPLVVDYLRFPATRWCFESATAWFPAAGLLVVFWRSRNQTEQFHLALASALWCLVLLFAVGYGPPARGDRLVTLAPAVLPPLAPRGGSPAPPSKVWLAKDHWIDVGLTNSHHPQFGHAGASLATGRDHHDVHFDLIYQHDADGFRRLPDNPELPADAPELDVLGCSVTYGIGVEAEQTYLARLATTAWKTLRVRGLAYSGYGPNHAARVLAWRLAQEPAPAAVLYGWISQHSLRLGLRRNMYTPPGQQFPRYVLRGAELAYLGIASTDLIPRATPADIAAQETRLSLALLRSIRASCAARGIPFVLLVLMRQPDDAVLRELKADSQFPLIDVSRASDDIYVGEGHPTARWHQAVAAELAGSARLAELLGRSELYQPAIIAMPRPLWRLDLLAARQQPVRLVGDLEALAELRLENLPTQTSKSWQVKLRRRWIALSESAAPRLSLEARSDAPRPFSAVLVHGQQLVWTTQEPIVLDDAWQTFAWQLPALTGGADYTLELQVGESSVPLAVRQVRLMQGDIDRLDR